MSESASPNPEHLLKPDDAQAVANLLSLLAILTRMEKLAIQRVLIALGSELLDLPTGGMISPQVTQKLIGHIAAEQGTQAALQLADDLRFVAQAWLPVLSAFSEDDPYRLLPYAEIVFQLINYSGAALHTYDAFESFGGSELALPFEQLAAAVRPYDCPLPALMWEMVGFNDPHDTALIASDESTIYVVKAASSGIDLRFSEIPRAETEEARRPRHVRIDAPLFAAFTAGLLGDMLYWVARLRSHALPGQQTWQQLQALLQATGDT